MADSLDKIAWQGNQNQVLLTSFLDELQSRDEVDGIKSKEDFAKPLVKVSRERLFSFD